MVHGAFKHMVHDHHFEAVGGTTRMVDRFDFAAPFGPLGRALETLVLNRHLRRFLELRNHHLKQTSEGDAWRRYLA